MKILLTGATGYLGQKLIQRLRGHELWGLSRQPGKAAEQWPHLHWLDNQTANFPAVDAVLHCATSYGRAGESPADVLQANTLLPLRWLERIPSPLWLNIGSALPDHSNPYSLSKSQFRDWARLLKEADFRHLRLEHFYGAGDHPGKFSAFVLQQCLRQAERLPLTAGEQRRDFLHIDDTVEAIICVLERGAPNLDIAIGSGNTVSLRAFVETIHQLTGSRTELAFGALPYRPQEVMHSQADTRALRALGWQPHYSLQTGLAQMVAAEKILLNG